MQRMTKFQVGLCTVVMRRQNAADDEAFAIGKGQVFPYSLPSVGPGADPGVQAVSPQVT